MNNEMILGDNQLLVASLSMLPLLTIIIQFHTADICKIEKDLAIFFIRYNIFSKHLS